jgi:hypothetical protein
VVENADVDVYAQRLAGVINELAACRSGDG